MRSRRSFLKKATIAAGAAVGVAWVGREMWRERLRNLRSSEYQRLIASIERLSAAGKAKELGLPDFMKFWSDAVLVRLRRARFPLDQHQVMVVARGSLLLPPAAREYIDAAQSKIGAILPESAHDLFATTNGLYTIIEYAAEPLTLWPIDRISRLKHADAELVKIWTKDPLPTPTDREYFKYGKDQDPMVMRTEYMPELICLTPVVDGGALLLNPAVKFASGEMEAWDFSVKRLGARRFESLGQMLEAQCESDCWLLDEWSVTHGWRREA
jgi:hypothetical protein